MAGRYRAEKYIWLLIFLLGIQDSAAAAVKAGFENREGILLLIEKKDHRLTVLQDGEPVRQYKVATGSNAGNKKKVGDRRTPEGEYTISNIHHSSSWKYDFKDGRGSSKGAYGPFFLRLRASPWQGIGIHGTSKPQSIGKNITAGCIRLHNRDIRELAGLVEVGTVVVIAP